MKKKYTVILIVLTIVLFIIIAYHLYVVSKEGLNIGHWFAYTIDFLLALVVLLVLIFSISISLLDYFDNLYLKMRKRINESSFIGLVSKALCSILNFMITVLKSFENAINNPLNITIIIILVFLFNSIYIYSIITSQHDSLWSETNGYFNKFSSKSVFEIAVALTIILTMFASLASHYYSNKTSQHLKRIQDFYTNLRDISAKVQQMYGEATEEIKVIATVPIPGLISLVDSFPHVIESISSKNTSLSDIEIMGLKEFYKQWSDNEKIWIRKSNGKELLLDEKLYSETIFKLINDVDSAPDDKMIYKNPKIKMILLHPLFNNTTLKEQIKSNTKIEEIFTKKTDPLYDLVHSISEFKLDTYHDFSCNNFVNTITNGNSDYSPFYSTLNEKEKKIMRFNSYYLGQFYLDLLRIAKIPNKLPKNFHITFVKDIHFLLFIVDNKALFTPLGTEWLKHVVLNKNIFSDTNSHHHYDEGNQLLFGIYTEDKKMVSILKEVFNRYFSMHYFLEKPELIEMKDDIIKWEYPKYQYDYFDRHIKFQIRCKNNDQKEEYVDIQSQLLSEDGQNEKLLFASTVNLPNIDKNNLKDVGNVNLLRAIYKESRPEQLFLTSLELENV